MFTDFLYLLRSHGMKVGLNEWNSLMEALELGLNEASLTEFYYMARAILVKKESDYDKFDQTFLEYFKNIKSFEELPKEVLEWLARTAKQNDIDKDAADRMYGDLSLEEIRKLLEERLKEQTEEHNGGTKWIGTGGATPFGHDGYAKQGIRIGGKARTGRALEIAEKRNYKDFRDDSVIQMRQFQMAFKKLRLLSFRDEGPKTELNIDKTIDETCESGGYLKIVMERPRKNQTKLLLLMDAGGSMWEYADICNRLFQAVDQSTHFKDLKIYYFHNCIYDYLYTSPSCTWDSKVSTDLVLKNLKPEYKAILVGDASMAFSELMRRGGCNDYYFYNDRPGIEWLLDVKRRFASCVWLNPVNPKYWEFGYGSDTIKKVKEYFPMFPLTAKGLEDSIQELKKNA